jgi:hypothetical protein
MTKSAKDLAAVGGRSLTDLKNMDTSGYLKFRPVTTPEGYEIKGRYHPIEGQWVRWDIRDAVFKKEGKEEVTQVIDYFLAVEGRERCLSSGSAYLRKALADSEALGKKIRITRSGEGFETRYTVEVLGD